MPQDPIEKTARSIQRLYDEHRERSTPQQRTTAQVKAMVGRPMFLAFLGGAIGLWIGANLLVAASGYAALGLPLFPWLQGVMTLVSLALITFVVGAQRHEDGLTERRDTPALELAPLSEQKTAKIIHLLEDFRRDSPHIADRRDQEAEVMA